MARALLRTAALAFTAAVALGGCGPKVPKIGALDASAVVLAFGDSLTHGTGAAETDSYPAVLEQLIGRKVVRAGVPGEVSASGLTRLPETLDEVRPQLLVLCHGGNDFLRKADETQTAQNVREMVKLARDRGIGVVLLATPKLGFGIVVPKFYAEIGRELAIPVEEGVLEEILGDKSLKSDLIHPNAKGYRRMAEAVAKLLGKAGAL